MLFCNRKIIFDHFCYRYCSACMFQNTSFVFINTKNCSKIWLCLRNRGTETSGAREETALLGARNRYALRLADHQRSSPYCAGWDRLEWHFLAVLYKPKVRLCSCRLYTNRKTLCFHSFVIIIACK